jgi:hypothetical protein
MSHVRSLTARLASNPTVVVFAAAAVAATLALVGDVALAGDATYTLAGTETGTLVEPMDGAGSGGPSGIGTGEGD